MNDYLLKAMGFNNQVKIYICEVTNSINYIGDKLSYLPSALDALGRTMSMGAMLGGTLKGDEDITIKVEGDGPIGKIIVDADAHGNFRGCVSNPHIHLENNDGTLSCKATVGTTGFISVIKDYHLKEPFIGHTPIISGELGEDFSYYFYESEQIPTVVSLGSYINDDSVAVGSGGFMIQILPGASDELFDSIEELIKKLPPLSAYFETGVSLKEILKLIDEKAVVLEEVPLTYRCKCSKERFRRGIKALGIEEIEEMIKVDHGAKAICNFCLEEYNFSEDELKEIYNEILKKI